MSLAALILAQTLQNGCPALPPDGGDWRDDVVPSHRIDPGYTDIAAAAGGQAICWVSYDITPDGRSTNLCTRCSVTVDPRLDARVRDRARAALSEQFAGASAAALRQWRFSADDSPTRCARQAFAFLLEGMGAQTRPDDPRSTTCMERPQG